MAWRAAAKMSPSAQVQELCWAESRLAVGYPYSIFSLVQKTEERDVNEPLTKVLPAANKAIRGGTMRAK